MPGDSRRNRQRHHSRHPRYTSGSEVLMEKGCPTAIINLPDDLKQPAGSTKTDNSTFSKNMSNLISNISRLGLAAE